MYVKALELLRGIQLHHQRFEVPEALGPLCVLERLVLGQNVDETFPHVIAVLAQQFTALFAEPGQHVPDLAVRVEGVRHWAVRAA
jgi:hypothetical protein